MPDAWPAWAMSVVPVAALLVLALVWYRILQGLRGPEPVPYSRVATADGAQLALYRSGNPSGRPVLLVAGFAASHMYWDFVAPRELGPDQSVTDYLAQQGLDVWRFDYRGHGHSRTPSLWSTYGFEHLVNEDLRTVVQAVLQARPGLTAKDLHLVGHSLGAIAVLAHLSQQPQAYGRSAVLAPPVVIAESTRPARWLVRNRAIISTWPVVAMGSFVRWFPYIYVVLLPAVASFLVTPSQVSRSTFLRWTLACLSDVSTRLTLEVMGWIARHGARWQRRDTRELLPAIATELLYVTSPDDRLAPSGVFEPLAGTLPPHSRWLDLAGGEPRGMCDMLAGRGALPEVWAPVVQWLCTDSAAV